MTATVLPLDLTRPSYRGAYHFARQLAVAGDRTGADRLFARLLWHVEGCDGGLLGLDDEQIEEKVACDPRLTMENVFAALWDRGQWPAAPEAVAA